MSYPTLNLRPKKVAKARTTRTSTEAANTSAEATKMEVDNMASEIVIPVAEFEIEVRGTIDVNEVEMDTIYIDPTILHDHRYYIKGPKKAEGEKETHDKTDIGAEQEVDNSLQEQGIPLTKV